MDSVARVPSRRLSVIGPQSVSILTDVRPGPAETVRLTGTCSRSASHMPSSSPLALSSSPSTSTSVTAQSTWSRAAASIERHGVILAHARSVSPGV